MRDRFERELMADVQTPDVEAKVGILQKNVEFELTRDAWRTICWDWCGSTECTV